MILFHVRKECDTLETGFNFYPWSDYPHMFGFVFKLGQWQWVLRLRRFGFTPRILNEVRRVSDYVIKELEV